MDNSPIAGHPAAASPATAEQELEHALNFLGHDARSGHSSTLALLDLHRIQPDPMSVSQLLERIEANARRSLDAIDDFADLIRARRQALHDDEFDCTDLLVEVVADAWTAAHQNGVRIQVAPGSASIGVRGDRALLAAALAKLLRDAVVAAAPGSEVHCNVAAEGAAGVFEIAEPVAPPARPASATTPRASRKVASSLLFARGVAERHGGQAVQSTGDNGRRTRLVLPSAGVPDLPTA
jgi:signal transduction histidine kinase